MRLGTPPLIDAYQALLDLAEAQRRVLAEGQLEVFLDIANERKQVFDAIQALNEDVGSLESGMRERVRAVVNQILDIDEELERMLRDRQGAIREELSRLQPGIQALRSYVQESNQNSFFIDRSH